MLTPSKSDIRNAEKRDRRAKKRHLEVTKQEARLQRDQRLNAINAEAAEKRKKVWEEWNKRFATR